METIQDKISAIKSLQNLVFNKQRRSFVFPILNNETARLSELGIDFDNDSENTFEIDFGKLGFNCFYSQADFIENVTHETFTRDVFLFSEDIFYNVQDLKTYVNFAASDKFFLLINNHYYFKILDFLESKVHKENEVFYFVDHFSYDSRLIVFTSLKKEGQLSILIPPNGINILDDINVKETYGRLLDAFSAENRHFPKFIKNEIVLSLIKESREKRMMRFICKLSEILNIAEQNFEIYLHDLSLENLRKDFLEHKNKYFQQLREILSKLTSQIIALPVAISASVFATYKIHDSIGTLILILIIFIIYSIYSLYLLILQMDDIKDIRKNFLLDFETIKSSRYFKKFSSELKRFDDTRRGLITRINKILFAFGLYYFIFSFSVVLFIAYIEFQISLDLMWIFISSLVFVFLSILSFCILDRSIT